MAMSRAGSILATCWMRGIATEETMSDMKDKIPDVERRNEAMPGGAPRMKNLGIWLMAGTIAGWALVLCANWL